MILTFAATYISTLPRQTRRLGGWVWCGWSSSVCYSTLFTTSKVNQYFSLVGPTCLALRVKVCWREHTFQMFREQEEPLNIWVRSWGEHSLIPRPYKERRGPGTHCLHMRRGSQKNVGYWISTYTLPYIPPRDALPWRSGTCMSSVYQALSPLFVGPRNEARGNTVCAAYQLTRPQPRALSSLSSST